MTEKRNNFGTLHRSRRLQAERLGEYFRRTQKISNEDFQRAFKLKQSANILTGMALMRLGLVTESDIATAISEISGIPLVQKKELTVQAEALKKIPETVIRKHNLLPLYIHNQTLIAGVDKPLSLPVLRSLERICRLNITQKLLTTSALQKSIALSFTSDTVIDAEGVSAIEVVNDLIIKAVKLNASDIHLEPMEERVRLRFRMDGVLHEIETYSHAQYTAIAARIKVLAGLDIAEKRMPQDGAITFSRNGIETDLRVSSLPSLHGEKIVMRLLAGKSSQLTIDQIGLSKDIYHQFVKTVKRPYGIVLIVGPTGSGKSTTLTAALNTINQPQINIVTVEDPIEYKIDGITQVHVSSQSGKMSFASALRSILRQDPDVIMVGETRDSETADISLRAALTGHMVFTTLHTNDAPGALPRLLDMGCEAFLVSSSVSGVLAQRLVRKLCPVCKKPIQPNKEQLDFLKISSQDISSVWYEASGCDSCNQVGYSGRTGIFEFLAVDKEIQQAVMERASGEKLTQIAIQNGMKTLREDALEKLNQGITSFEEVIRVTIG